MPSRAQDIVSYPFTDRDRLLVDANVWLFVHGPNKPRDARVSVYSSALARCIAAKSIIHIDALILSEFINRYARLKYNILYSSGRITVDFKRFRDSVDFKPVAREIADAVRRVLAICNRTESGFSTVDILSLINAYEAGGLDFNDQMIADLCQRQGLVLVTHDGDFSGSALGLVTANKKLLP